MIRIVSTNITSPLGLTTEENYAAVKRGGTALRLMDGCLGVPGRFCVGVFSDSERASLRLEGFSWFESLVLRSVKEALERADVDPSSPGTILILGTSTAGIEELGPSPERDGSYLAPGLAAEKVAASLGFVNDPITVSNACISGATAQMLACRLLSAGEYDCAVVCGADVVSAFVLAGFSSFKALSPTFCRPFDIERLGLNIGECASTMVLRETGDASEGEWGIADGCLNNDAYHVSAPIPSGDGLYRSIARILTPELKDSLACVTAHGTATMFNDQMESKALEKAGLGDVPATAYKAHFGHTFGASGVVEPIITMKSLDEGLVLPAAGFSEIGVSGRIKVCDRLTETSKSAFIKTQSGFGSCNGSIIYTKMPVPLPKPAPSKYGVVRSLSINPSGFILDGESVEVEGSGAALVTGLFRKYLSDGSRFFKMDLFSRLAYVGAGILAKDGLSGCEADGVALLVFTLNGSVIADRRHLSTFSEPGEFYPSPSVFINTLPNVVLGEIAVSFGIKGETTLVMLPRRDDGVMERIIGLTAAAAGVSAMICGWVDCEAEDSFCADIKMLKIK